MTVAVIIQARMGSSRLPGKVMQKLGGRSVLAHVIARCQSIALADIVCVATVARSSEDPIAEEALRCGAALFRGSEQDVLGRYRRAAEQLGADQVMRVTSDCPLIDPEVCGLVLGELRQGGWDYVSNNLERSWPHGLDCEAMPFHRLAEADAAAGQPDEREHVTPWLRRHPNLRRANIPCPQAGCAGMRWTLDYPEDLEFFRALWQSMPDAGISNWRQIVEHLGKHPELSAINAGRAAF
jgi:spore coat polysaccharide biosynthesis protein SpsF